ncbi:3-deoxy-manno-octulosonate cytidylyltransferase [hydrothermal vent metagenome]|uniref:3-deoxy-manno-octulosonate cytidylyltransferase n=1 Tax=hydrothermal vent metagenome TaxID=652676 RepID=A0A3B1AMR9_9ZZZZ
MDFKVVIPARYASTRLPGKPVLDIAGKPMIQHVHERACESAAGEVVIATDDERVANCAKNFGAQVCMTSASHHSGTDRIAEVIKTLGWPDDAIVVNLQGDEPCMPAVLIDQVAKDIASHKDANITTLSSPITDKAVLFDPHAVKVVTDTDGYALYFSRAPIPWHRDEFPAGEGSSLPTDVAFARHVGMYAYRARFLEQFVSWPQAPLELAESLEQLRVLWHGGKIHVTEVTVDPGHGVDTEEDLQRAEEQLAS